MGQPRLFLSAGDPSGDNAAARVVTALQERFPELELSGLGGRRLNGLGQRQLTSPDNLAVLGFWEVARRYFFFRKLFHRCLDDIRASQPGAVVLVDYPGFNLRLAKVVHGMGIPVIYYISPQVWAWGKGRIPQMRENISRMLVILPFEEAFFGEHGIDCTFVGHYLVEDIADEYIASDPPGRRQLALLPGSRRQEVERMLPSMLKAAAEFNRRHGWTTVVAAVGGVRDRYDYDAVCRPYAEHGVSVMYDDSRRVIAESDLAITASGTATLETGIIGRPMVVVYKTGWITYQIARRLVKLDRIGLVNLVAREKVVPELIQEEAKPENMVAALEKYLGDESYTAAVCEKLRRIPSLLGGAGASARAAEEIGRFL